METVLVAETSFPLEKLSVLCTLWINQLNSEEHGEREESAVVTGYFCHFRHQNGGMYTQWVAA
jgi:hypothetical protein